MAEWTGPDETPIRLTRRGWVALTATILATGWILNTLIPLDAWGRL